MGTGEGEKEESGMRGGMGRIIMFSELHTSLLSWWAKITHRIVHTNYNESVKKLRIKI